MNLTIEENHSLQFAIVEEVIERPQATVLAEWIRVEIWVVAVGVRVASGGLLEIFVEGRVAAE